MIVIDDSINILWSSVMIIIMFIKQTTVTTIINYNRNMLVVQATVATIINYNRKMFIIQATDVQV